MRQSVTLCLSSAGVFLAFSLHAYFAERLSDARYGDRKFIFPATQLFIGYGLVLLLAAVARVLTGDRAAAPWRNPRVLLASAASVVSLECALRMSHRLSYLFQTLFRASKFLSLTLAAFLTGGPASRRDVTLAALSALGLSLFLVGGRASSHSAQGLGVALGVLSLLADCVVAQAQRGLRAPSFLALMLASNAWNAAFSFVTALLRGELVPALRFLAEHPMAARDQLLTALSFAAGSFFVFFHLQRFGPLSLAYVTSVRKVCSILASCVLFGHDVRGWRAVGITIIVLCIAMDVMEAVRKSSHHKKSPQPPVSSISEPPILLSSQKLPKKTAG